MGDSNFQHFLKVLEEVVAEKPKECKERRLKTIPEKEILCSLDGMSDKLAPILDVKAVKSKYKLRRHPLRRPGFIYRSRDLSKTSFLKSNIWEFTCGRRVLKSPTFKYQERRKFNTSPYSMQILEGFNNMSLLKKITPIHSCRAKTVDLKYPVQTQQDLSKNQPSFLPLSKCTDIKPKANVPYSSKFSKPFIRPSKLRRVCASKRTEFPNEWCGSAKDSTIPLGCHAVMDAPLFGDLSAQIEPLVVRKFASQNFNEFRESSNSRHIDSNAASNPVINEPSDDIESELQSTPKLTSGMKRSCSFEARLSEQDGCIDEMSMYMDDYWFFPQKMSTMAEMMYT